MIKYKKAKELLDSVSEDLEAYADSGLIDNSRLYKIIRRCNAMLGEKINPEKEEIIIINNYKGRLPDDFQNMNFAFICRHKKANISFPSGFHVEYKTLCENKATCSPSLSQCGKDYVIVQKCNDEFVEYSKFDNVRVTTRSFKFCSTSCPNMWSSCDATIDISEDGWIKTNFQSGVLYINYVGSMEDCDGDLLILDHPMVEPYYEASVTNQIFKSLVRNKSSDVVELYKDSKMELSLAQTRAISFISVSGYDEIKDLFMAQRRRFLNKYFTPIDGA